MGKLHEYQKKPTYLCILKRDYPISGNKRFLKHYQLTLKDTFKGTKANNCIKHAHEMNKFWLKVWLCSVGLVIIQLNDLVLVIP